MTSPVRTLLIVGAACWVAPLGAEPRESAVAAIDGESSCPYSHAEAAQVERIVVKAEAPLTQHSRPAAALLP